VCEVIGATTDAAGVGRSGAAVRAGGGLLRAVGAVSAAAVAAQDVEDIVRAGVVRGGGVDCPVIGGRGEGDV